MGCGSLPCSDRMPEIFKPSWSFEQIGIGGLDDQLSDIFRRAFAPRVLPRNVTQELGIDPVRGAIVSSPPLQAQLNT